MRSHPSIVRVRVSNAPGGAAGLCFSRGLFIAGDGSVVNADVNAAYNIITKAFPKALAEEIEDVSVHPVRMPLGTACECTYERYDFMCKICGVNVICSL